MEKMFSARMMAVSAVALGAVLVGLLGWIAMRDTGAPTLAVSREAPAAVAAREDAAVVLRHAIALVRGRDYAGADRDLHAIAAEWPKLNGAYFYAALVDDRLGRTDSAQTQALHYLASSPADAAGHELLARTLIDAGQPDRAAATLAAAASEGRVGAEAFVRLGRSYADAGYTERATRAFDRAGALAPDDGRMLAEVAGARLGLPDEHEADDLAPGTQSVAARLDAAEAAVHVAAEVGDTERATAAVEALRRLPGGAERAAIAGAAVAAARLDQAGARVTLNATLGTPAMAARARIGLARLDVIEGRTEDARQALAEVLRADPTDMAAIQELVGLLLARNDTQAAAGVLDAARAAAPGNPVFTVMLADLVLRFGDAARSLATLDAAPAQMAGLTAVMEARARALVAAGRANEARDIYTRILAREPNRASARSQLLDLLLARGDFDAARALLRDGLRAGGDRLATMEALVRVEARWRGQDGGAAAADQLAAEPANLPLARVLKGDFYSSGQHYPEAMAAYAEQIRVAPNGMLVARLASAMEAGGQYEQALILLRNWVGSHSDDVAALTALASLELGSKRVDDAIAHLSAAVGNQPDNGGALNDLAWAYQLKGDPRGREMARRAYLAAPTAEVADTLGWIIASGGQAGIAVPILRRAVAAMPGNPTVLYHYAAALRGAGMAGEAARVAGQALEQPGNFAERRAAGQLLAELSRKP